MKRLFSCEFNFDTVCVEHRFSDGSMISIDTIAVENEVADNMYRRSELIILSTTTLLHTPIRYSTATPKPISKRSRCTSRSIDFHNEQELSCLLAGRLLFRL